MLLMFLCQQCLGRVLAIVQHGLLKIKFVCLESLHSASQYAGGWDTACLGLWQHAGVVELLADCKVYRIQR